MHGEFVARRVGKWLREKYRLDAVIGVGGMAAVYRGAHRNGNRVAVKVLHTELAINAEMRARFLKEGYVANAVEHPGAVRVLDDDVTDDGAVFIVMELLEGETLDSRWTRARRRLPAPEVAELAYRILGVLAAAHAKGIVHRDIKPENLFLTQEGQVKVLDFGIARMRDDARAATRTGRMLGTPAYMPKEQALGLTKQIDGRTDLWALGATMFTLLSGRPVHEGETPESMIVFTATRPARPLSSVMPDVPAALASVIDRALAFEMSDRFADAPAMQAALETAHREAFGGPIGAPAARALLCRVASPAAAPVPLAPPTPRAAPAVDTLESSRAAAHDEVEIEPLLLGLGAGGQRMPEKARALELPKPVVAVAPIAAPLVLASQIAPSLLGSAHTMPIGVSTTAGVSSEERPYFRVHPGIAPAIAPPARSRTMLAVAIGCTVGGVVAVVALGVMLRTKPSPAKAEDRPSPSEQASVPTSRATVAPSPVASVAAGAAAESAAPLPSNAPFIAPSGASTAPALASAAVPIPRPKGGGTAAPPSPRPRPSASPMPAHTCDPPYTIDSAGHHVLKLGC